MIAEFYWKATNRFGQKLTGKNLAANREQLEKQLRQKGYEQIKISRNFVLPTSPKSEEITQLLNQISLLLTAHIPLKTSLAMVQQSCQQIRLYQWLNDIQQGLESGLAFSASLDKSDKYLTPQEIQLIKMGETSGQLATIFGKMVEARQKSEKLQKKVKKILFYPVVVLIISLSLSLLLLLFVVPQFAELYGEKSLPLITDVLFNISHFLKSNHHLLIGITILCCLIISILSQKTIIITKLKFHLLIHLPIFRNIVKQNRIIFFCQHTSLMLNAHLRLDVILQSFLQGKQQDPILEKEIKLMLQLLQQGYRLNEGLSPTIFGNEMVQMVAIGEQSGKLAEMLGHISEIHQQRLDYHIDLLSQLLEPMLMLIMGVIVGTIIVGLYLPIFDMGAMIQ
ncbi:MAG: type II secretion system F family protein [Pasteurellaceae bacterium]|nr:type II secretion system F family protein [Pasteurellaceae bacterium]